MDYNYHTHTHRCSHASGTDEDYILAAIKGGIKYMGFSDHIPLVCDDGFETGYRVPMSKAQDYVESLRVLKEKYKGKIDIKIGFEAEYYREDFDKMLKSAIDLGAEYLILGQHFLFNEHNGGVRTMIPTDSVDDLKEYVSLVIEAMQSKVITYVAHPDIFNFTGDDEIYRREMSRLCLAAKEYNIPLEINFLGIFKKRSYPVSLFWKMAGETQAPVTFGFDAHAPERAFDGESLKVAKQMVKDYNLNYIGRPKILPIK